MECEVVTRAIAGDHVLVTAQVRAVQPLQKPVTR